MMPTTKPTERTNEELTRASYYIVRQTLGIVKRKRGHITLTKAQSKRIFQALHTITLYLHQPEKVRFGQIERLLEVRDMFEAEYEEQLGEAIDKPAVK